MTKRTAAIFGIGRIGQVHLRNMVHCNRLVVKWLVDVEGMRSKAQELTKLLRLSGEAQFINIDDADRVFNDSEVEVIVVCVPTSYHANITIKALETGKHVFCEKPLAPTIQDVRKCYDAAKKNNRTLMCAVNRRFDKQFRAIYDMKRKGELGSIRVIKMTGRDMGNSEEYYRNNTGGIFFDMGIHDVDYICWLASEKPSSVYATGRRRGPSAEMYKRLGEYDSASALLTFPSGTVGMLELSRECGFGYDQNVEVLGTKTCVKTKSIKESELETILKSGIRQEPILESFITRYEQSFYDELNHFIDVIEGREQCLVTPESYTISTEVVTALTQSLETGQIVHL